VAKGCQKAPAFRWGFFAFLQFAGLLEQLEGFEPPIRGLGMRLYASYLVLTCQRNPHKQADFDSICGAAFLLCPVLS
jgi:hypothetical protein